MTSNLIPKSRIVEGDPRHKSHEEVLHMVQQLQSENKNLMFNHDTMVKDINRRLQVHLMEIQGLRNVNQKLQDDNQELRDLCCFLDDERQSGKKLAKDWQKFGRYTASVMQTEVTNYHEKLRELEVKQEELIKDNLEMQELCLYMGREHLFDNDRDDGDGSSNGTTGGNEKIEEVNQTQTPSGDQSGQNSIPDQTLNYIKHLEELVRKLKEERNNLSLQLEQQTNDANSNYPNTFRPPGPVRAQMVTSWSKPANTIGSTANPPRTMQYPQQQQQQQQQQYYHQQQEKYHQQQQQQQSQQYQQNLRQQPEQKHQNPPPRPHPPNPSSQPDAVTHAMKVLEVHQQLESPMNNIDSNNDLGDNEKAIVREMCNVVWRKLESTSPRRQYPPKQPNSSLEHEPARTSQQTHQPRNSLSRPPPPTQQKQSSQPYIEKHPSVTSYPQQFYPHHSPQSPPPSQKLANSNSRYSNSSYMTRSRPSSSSTLSPTSKVKPMPYSATENRIDQRHY
ncbi:Hypothetical predicted protein [Octopus vulgaris]|uniref:Coiled-coil domain-containing protein 85C n=1 Tax=Octopus vulgaris TaxID=6645 RepID=A0AA36EX53_OCTVU|nr:Hypothetical predicted protein [Octopus vulgaris]